MLSTIAVKLDVVRVELSDSFVIELNPFIFWLLDVTEIVTELCRPVVQIDALKDELIILWISLSFLFVDSVIIDVEFKREFKSWVDLFVFKFFIVEANSL